MHTRSYCSAQPVKEVCMTLVVMQLIYNCVSLTHKTAAVSFITSEGCEEERGFHSKDIDLSTRLTEHIYHIQKVY